VDECFLGVVTCLADHVWLNFLGSAACVERDALKQASDATFISAEQSSAGVVLSLGAVWVLVLIITFLVFLLLGLAAWHHIKQTRIARRTLDPVNLEADEELLNHPQQSDEGRGSTVYGEVAPGNADEELHKEGYGDVNVVLIGEEPH
jgi:hypothetical protein